MKEIRLDGKKMKTKEGTHLYLQDKLNLPKYYGKNLDALWDVLSCYNQSLIIRLANEADLIMNLGTYGESIVKLLKEVSLESSKIEFID